MDMKCGPISDGAQVAGRTESRLLDVFQLLEGTADYVSVADGSGSTLYLNPAARALLGLGPNDTISRTRICQYSDEETQRRVCEEGIPTAIREGAWTGASRLRDRQGREFATSHLIMAQRADDGQLQSLYTFVTHGARPARTAENLRQSSEELRRLSGLLVATQEEERRRVAMDLHDGLGQSLCLIKMSLENCARLLADKQTHQAGEILQQLIARSIDAMIEVRRVCTQLRPSMIDDLGMVPTLSWFFREFEQSCPGIAVEKVFNVAEQDVPAALRITVYRILQEAIHNVVKHAQASLVRVRIERIGDVLHLLIQDNGRGFDANAMFSQTHARGLGLLGMHERASLSGGAYQLKSSPGHGTAIWVCWPCIPT